MSEIDLRVPPEWAPQRAVWAGWPHIRGEWGEAFDGARAEISTFLRVLSESVTVKVACGSREAYGSAMEAFGGLAPQIELHTVPSGDIWLRDTGPIMATRANGLEALIFEFNGWGGKYEMPGDTLTAGGIASVEGTPRRRMGFVLEGGAVDQDGAGRLLTTRQCVLNPNRNPGWTQATAEAALREAFQVEQVIWLGDGLLNDHTDGHVDNIARFIAPGIVACQSPSGADDPNADTLNAIEAELRAAGVEVVLVPSPGLILDEEGEAVPASHMNFLISNRRVLLPVYDEVNAARAVAALQAALPDYAIVPLPARSILSGGGSFHCMTQQIPEI